MVDIDCYFLIGINYKKTDIAHRGLYALEERQYRRILENIHLYPVKDFVLIATCNRTEIYGFCADPKLLVKAISQEIKGTEASFLALAYQKQGRAAMQHLFEVTAGLDAQILGDYEIVGQVKKAFQIAKEYQQMSNFTERLYNSALQASKKVRTQTKIGDGIMSVSMAAVQFIKQTYPKAYKKKHILLIGLGEIGKNTFKNIRDYLGELSVTLINRDPDKSQKLAGTCAYVLLWEDIVEGVDQADIIITATAAPHPFIFKECIKTDKERLFLDLSLPRNVDPELAAYPNNRVVHIDELSQAVAANKEKRQRELPKALAVVEEVLAEFTDWVSERKQLQFLKQMKQHLQKLNDTMHEGKDQKVIQEHLNHLALEMRKKQFMGCSVIRTYKDFLYGQKK